MLSRQIYSQSCKLEHQIDFLNVVLSVFKAGNENTTATIDSDLVSLFVNFEQIENAFNYNFE